MLKESVEDTSFSEISLFLQEAINDDNRNDFPYPFLRATKSCLESKISKLKNYENKICLQQYIENVCQAINEQLLSIWVKALTVETHLNNGNTQIDVTVLKDNYVFGFERTLTYLQNTVNYHFEVLSNFLNDYKLICSFLKESSIKLTNIQFCGGDQHQKSKQALLLTFGKYKIFYKPHNEDVTHHFGMFLSNFNAFLPKKLHLKHCPTLVINDHTWQKKIEYKECNELSDVSIFYKKEGILLALMYIFGTVDMHYENIIVNGTDPYLIDLETWLSNERIKNKTMERQLITNSVLRTCMLPYFFKNSNFDYDISGVAGTEGQKTNLFYDEMSIEKGKMKFRQKKLEVVSKKNVPQVCGTDKRINPLKFKADLKKGFKLGYSIFHSNKRYFMHDKLSVNLFNGDTCRYIVRPTSSYEMLLDALNSPKYQASKTESTLLVDQTLHASKSTKKFICRSEKFDILNGDYPLFKLDFSSRDLKNSNDDKLNNFFDQSSKEMVVKRIMRLNPEDLGFQLRLIDISFSMRREYAKQVSPQYTIDNCVKALEKNIFQIHGQAYQIGLSDPFTLKTGLLGSELIFGNMGLYSGDSGLLIVYALLVKKFPGNDEYKQMTKRLIDKLTDLATSTHAKFVYSQLNAFNGIGSIIYALLYVGNVLHKPELIKTASKVIDDIYSKTTDENFTDANPDYIGGLASFILVLTNAYPVVESRFKSQLLFRIYSSILVSGTNVFNQQAQSNVLTGLGHGLSGIALGISAAESRLSVDSQSNLVNRLLEYEDKFFDKENKQWLDLRDGASGLSGDFFCYGAPGILLARYLISEKYHENKLNNNFFSSLKRFRNEDYKVNGNNLCHGNLGNQLILKTLDPNYKLPSISKEDYEDIRISDQGLLTGTAGRLYYLMKQANNGIPNILMLEV